MHKKSYLRHFELVNAQLREEDLISLSEYVLGSKLLQDLDLSQNGLVPHKMEILLRYFR